MDANNNMVIRFFMVVAHVISKALDAFVRSSFRTKLGSITLFCFLLYLSLDPLAKATSRINVLTWNTAAINNNPFEYWLTIQDKKYDEMMNAVQNHIQNPKRDPVVSNVFEIDAKMQSANFPNIDKISQLYESDWSKRKSVKEFLKDGMIGKKRLVSMPDRVTNTIKTKKGTFFRPTPINCYNGPRFTGMNDWFEAWLSFMFDTPIDEDGNVPTKLLVKIPHAKYPELTIEEEAISIPLQTMVLCLFDGIQVHMLNQYGKEWQQLRSSICTNLNTKKVPKTIEILTKTYRDADIIFLQETAASFVDELRRSDLGLNHAVIQPTIIGSNDQNSIIVLRKDLFNTETTPEDVTQRVLNTMKKDKAAVSAGDLIVITIEDIYKRKYLLASFHGDTNGLATIPVVRAVREFHQKEFTNYQFLFGLDANTYETIPKGKEAEYQGVTEFNRFFVDKMQVSSCWGNSVNPKKHTTRNARTFLQPQLSKAAAKTEIAEKGDANPKDFVLFDPKQYKVKLVGRDNTGEGSFIDGMVFPTLDFPSDHAILRTVLEEV